MTFHQHPFRWLFAAIITTAVWTGCAPEFNDHICTQNTDCFANETCLANTCVVLTPGDDVGTDTDHTDTGNTDTGNTDTNEHDAIPALNACMGPYEIELDNEPGEPCGPCNLDEYICDGTVNTVCSGETACPEIALVTTLPTEISATAATLHGQIQSLTDDLPTDHGFCWSLELSPTDTNGDCHSLGALTADQIGEAFTHTIDELNPGSFYHVRAFHTDSTGTVYANAIEFTTLAPAPTNFTASQGTHTQHVQLDWDEMPGAVEYIVYRNDVLLDVLEADTTTFNDTRAEPAALTAPQDPSATQGTSHLFVSLTANPGVPAISSLPYAVRAVYPNAQSDHSEIANGHRALGPITYQWERSASDADQDFSPLAGAVTRTYLDMTAPENGDTRFYRLVASAEDADSQTSASVSGFRAETGEPAIHSVFISDITTTEAKLDAIFYVIGTPPATEHGFCWGTTVNPETDCIELGTPPTPTLPQAVSFDYALENLTPGTPYHVRAFLTQGTTRYYSDNFTFQTTPLPPVASASTDEIDHVTVSWPAVPGATSYEVFRDGTSIATGVILTSYVDDEANAAPPAPAPTLTATNASAHVVLTWTAVTPTNGTAHDYTVVAVYNFNQKSTESAPTTGYRAAHPVSAYEVSTNSNAWISTGNVLTYNAPAPAPTINPGTATAPPSTILGNTLTLTNHSIADGAITNFQVRAVAGQHGTASATQTGRRIADPDTLTIQWEESTAPTGPFTIILGATGPTYSDTAPNGIYFRAAVSAPGATTEHSNTVQSNP